MADELTIQSQIRIAGGAGELPAHTLQKSFRTDQATPAMVTLSVSCTTNTTAIDLSGLAELGWTFVENLETTTTNTVIVSAFDATNEVEAFVVEPQEGYVVKLSDNVTYRAKTSAGTATLFVEALDG